MSLLHVHNKIILTQENMWHVGLKSPLKTCHVYSIHRTIHVAFINVQILEIVCHRCVCVTLPPIVIKFANFFFIPFNLLRDKKERARAQLIMKTTTAKNQKSTEKITISKIVFISSADAFRAYVCHCFNGWFWARRTNDRFICAGCFSKLRLR